MPGARVETSHAAIIYPDCDGQPMSDNTLQMHWIVMLYGNLQALYRDRDDVFVAGDHLWYPVEGHPEIRTAPDTMVVFGRPKGYRGSYKQWEEGDTPVTVAFEVMSPSNTPEEMVGKHLFYEEHGVEEYYVIDPDNNLLNVHLRRGEMLRPVRFESEFVSPRMGIRFVKKPGEISLSYPDGRPFLSFEELDADRLEAERRAAQLQAENEEAERRAAQLQAANEEAQKCIDRLRAETEEAQRLAEQATRRAARILELSRKARKGQATAEELEELDRLEESL